MSYRRRRTLDLWDELRAVAVGAAAGAVAAYLARLWLQRERLPPAAEEPRRAGTEDGEAREGDGGADRP